MAQGAPLPALLRRGFALEYVTLAWNVVGIVVLAVAAAAARSVALAGFGLDSLIEIGASTVVIWELSGTGEDRQRRGLRLIGCAFAALAVYLVAQSTLVLATGYHPRHSVLGIVWTAVTAVAMFALAAGKARTGKALGNPVLQTEGRVTMIDGVLAAAVLFGLTLNAALGWWWADPAAGYVLAWYAGREVREIFTGHGRESREGKNSMPGRWPPVSGPARSRQLTTALRLVWVSVDFGVLSGALSVITGLQNDSMGVLATGLGVLADVTGSATLAWRFRAERRQPRRSRSAEARAASVVAASLAIVSLVIIVESGNAIAAGSRPGASSVTIVAAAISLVVLTPLAWAKRRLGARMASRALQGDAALSGIAAATSLLALTAVMLYDTLGWWWADRAVALVVAAVAAAEAWRTAPRRLS